MNVRELRLKKGITQEQLAHVLGVTLTTVNRWEKGHSEPTGLSKKALEEYFKENNDN